MDAIEWAADNGITYGCLERLFCPDQPLKRKNAIRFLERFYDEVLGADGDGEFVNAEFTRADMVALLYKMVEDARSGE